MAVKFIPTGTLDITTNAALLPSEVNGKGAVSGAMRRCTNLRLDEPGRARTRFGSTKGSTAIHAANLMIEKSGYRYEFGGDEIYQDEASLVTGLTNAQWSAAISKAFNETSESIYALNGTDRKRITDDSVNEWGITPPTDSGSLITSVDYVCTYDWERELQIQVPVSTALLECDVATLWTVTARGAGATVTADTSDFKESTASVKGNWPLVASGGVQTYYLLYTFAANQNWSTYSTLTFWMKHNFSGSQSHTPQFYIEDAAGVLSAPILPHDADNVWTNHTINTADLGSVDLTTVKKVGIKINFLMTVRSQLNVWMDVIQGFAPGNYQSTNVFQFTPLWADATTEYNYIHTWEKQTLDDITEEDILATTYLKLSQWGWELSNNTLRKCWVKYTYLRKDSDGLILYESNPSSAMQMEPGGATIISFTTTSDPQVTHIRLYRTNYNATIHDDYYYDSEWDASTNGGRIYTEDNELSVLLEDDHNRPPLGSIVAGPNFGGYLFIAKGNLLYYCKANQPEYWPELYYVEVGSADKSITSIEFWNGATYALTGSEIYMISGTGHGNFLPVQMKAKTGVKLHTNSTSVKGQGIMRVANDGIYLFTLTDDQKITAKGINNIFYNETVENILYLDKTYLTRAFIQDFKNKIYFFYPGTGETYSGQVIVVDIDSKKIMHFDYGKEFTAVCVDYTNDRLYACDTDGYIWQLEVDTATTDNAVAIAWQIQSKEFSDPLYKYFPRYAKYDLDVTSGTAYGYILLNDAIKQTHTITGSRQTRFRHVTGCTGDRLALRLAGSGVVSIYGAEVE